MKRLMVFEEEEFNDLLAKFIYNFMVQSKEGYGVSLVNNETGERLVKRSEVGGAFLIPWNKTFNVEQDV